MNAYRTKQSTFIVNALVNQCNSFRRGAALVDFFFRSGVRRCSALTGI